ncbi:MAG TPA: hypothetical protein VGL72_06230 [Bryobacteraceae bacterium]
MTRTSYFAYFTLTALAASGLALAQDTQNTAPSPDPNQPSLQQPNNAQNHGWRRVDDPAPADAAAADPQQADQGAQDQAPPPQPPPPPNARPNYYPGQPAPPNYSTAPPNYQGAPPNYQGARPNYQGAPPNYQGAPPNYQGQQATPPPPVPASLTIKPGTYITVRVNQVLSSDHNHPGDAFAATLVRPVVIDGIVVAERGQTIGGKVSEAKKAGMVEGTSRLGITLTDLTLADGQNVPVATQLISRDGPTSVGRDAGAIAGTTALGAAAGAAADWGRGAAIGAGAGAFVGIVGVLLTRGHPTIIYPEQVLTFKLENPITVSTEHAPQAFRYVEPGDYQQNDLQRRGPPPTMRMAGPPAPYYGAPYYYGPAYSPYYWGPSIGFYYGPGYYYRGWRR